MNKYNEYLIPDNIKKVRIDIGLSFHAPISNKWLLKESNLVVFGFEPNPESCKRILMQDYGNRWIKDGYLEKKFIDNKTFQLFQYALDDTNIECIKPFYISQIDCGTSSLYTNNNKSIGPIKEIVNVPTISLKLFFDNFPWERFDYIEYLKIDAQGSDFKILKGAGEYLKDRVVYVTAEPDGHYYIGSNDCNEENINNYMLSLGFIRINSPYTKDPTYFNTKFIELKDKINIDL